MLPGLMLQTLYFDTFEAREEAFRQSVSALIPRKYSGPRLFWKDFARTGRDLDAGWAREPVAYITANPRDCLVYGTPLQILSAARMCALGASGRNVPTVEAAAERFQLEGNLDQPVRTLSGGETVKVALAKAFLAAYYCRQITIASPFAWLSLANRMHFDDLAACCRQLGVPLRVLALSGEDSAAPLSDAELPSDPVAGAIDFRLDLDRFSITLTTSINPLYQHHLRARVENFAGRLHSPCLLTGENGQGKSLIAKALVGALACEGTGRIRRDIDSGPARLLFQDVISQTLLRNFDGVVAASGRDQSRRAMEIYAEIMAALPADAAAGAADPERGGHFRSLLEMKAVLTAVRLCSRPGALILDEPDWGLGRSTAAAFVGGVIGAAHRREIPVMLISHKPWWSPIAGSALQVERTPTRSEGEDRSSFTIRISAGPEQAGRIPP